METTKQKFAVAPLIREHITKQIQNKYDYSTATSRKQDILNFMEIEKEKLPQDYTLAKVRSSHDPILKQLLKQNKIDTSNFERQSKGQNKLKYKSDMNKSNIDPKPQKGKNDETPQTKSPEQLTQEIPAQAIQAYSVEAVSATFSALFLTLKVAVPQLEDLTEDEKKALGEMWQPAFNLYLQNEKLAVIGIPILSTLGLFVPKIIAGRRKGKIAKSKEEGLLRQKEIDDKNKAQQDKIDEEKKTRGVIETQTETKTIPQIGVVDSNLTLPKKENPQNE